MPVFALDEQLVFPHPILSEPDGLLAVGGSLSTRRLLLAYRWGIFPWYHDDQPILWWWPSPRLGMKPTDAVISHSMRNVINQKQFDFSFDQQFNHVIEKCSSVPRKGQEGTWIVDDMKDAYAELHSLGYAHSVEVYENDQIVGGLYGIALGNIFFGESMFAEKPNASKFGFIRLAQYLEQKGFLFIDCQQDTPHMRSLGGKLISGENFLQILRKNHKFMLDNNTVKSLF